MNFQELKQEILQRAEKAHACFSQYQRAKNAENIDELIEVIKNNLSFVHDNDILPKELIENFEKQELFGIGKKNSGLFNSGDYNSGHYNSGHYNSGDRNSGNHNSGYYNIGNYNSGNHNSGDYNSRHYNSGDYNSGDYNSGDYNSGDYNSGYHNSGNHNSGNYNSGYYNNGYCNSGVFCNRKYEDKVIIFNRESDMTWEEWFNSKVYKLSSRLEITKWVSLKEMTDKEKIENPKAETANGYLKVYEYKEAWRNLWETFTEEEKQAFTTLPNFDSEVFEDITGIKVCLEL